MLPASIQAAPQKLQYGRYHHLPTHHTFSEQNPYQALEKDDIFLLGICPDHF